MVEVQACFQDQNNSPEVSGDHAEGAHLLVTSAAHAAPT